jgi:hypothetical protein
VVEKVRKKWQYVNKKHRSLMGKDLTSGSYVSCRLGKYIRLSDGEDINRVC